MWASGFPIGWGTVNCSGTFWPSGLGNYGLPSGINFADDIGALTLPDVRLEPKGCTCDSRVLFNGGCQCGWFKMKG